MSAAPSDDAGSSTSTTLPKKEPEVGGYRAIFGRDSNQKPIPKWVPIALLAFSTAAMSVPIMMLRRHRAATLGKALEKAPPPPARRSASMGVPIANPTSTSLPPSQSSTASTASSSSSKPEDNFNGALHCAKAFGIATVLVGVGAMTTVWGIRHYMGVETTQEFADKMRMAVLRRMPGLSARIHRAPEPEDGAEIVLSEPRPNPNVALPVPPLSPEEVEKWTWTAAERRLKEAFDRDGFYGWAAAALRELEAEGHLERTKRGHV
ncbi:hypothetical protein NUW54_g4506 [Trametes sanguinea]|uniref:Uncharacterized protein n=1 Tax=Trametes sanguinea TaxID=158606 RepID=A0ACC1PYR8_9APHY|nr:hypothetical protein NUW54_g4506 [Trametes sanguinea]